MQQVLLFRLGERPYGLEVDCLQEIVESPALFYIPMAPAVFSGAINFHGSILPVLDLAGHLGIAGGSRDSRVIVLPPQLCPLAFTVTALRRIVPLDPDALVPHQEMREEDFCIRCQFDWGGEMINLLDINRLMASLRPLDQRRR